MIELVLWMHLSEDYGVLPFWPEEEVLMLCRVTGIPEDDVRTGLANIERPLYDGSVFFARHTDGRMCWPEMMQAGPRGKSARPRADDGLRPSQRMRFDALKRGGFTCVYCGRRAPDVVLHVDHVVPVSAGGLNSPDNLVVACSDCNLGKGARPLESAR